MLFLFLCDFNQIMPDQKYGTRALIVLGSLLFLSFIFPLHIHPYRSFFHDMLAFLAVSCSIACLFTQPRVKVRFPLSLLLPVFLIVIIALQTWNGLVLMPVDSLFPVIYLLGFAVAMVLGASLADMEGGQEKLCLTLAWTFIGAGLVSVLCAQVQLLDWNNIPLFVMPLSDKLIRRPYGNLGQPNMLALLLCFAMASLWWSYLTLHIGRRSGLLLAVLFLWGITLTQSRIGWVILPLFTVLCWNPVAQYRAVPKKIIALLLFIYIAMVVLTPHLLALSGIAVQSVQERAGQTAFRLVYWKQALFIGSQHPWLGVGWFQFGPQQVMLASLFGITEYSEYVHNIVLNFVVELGWPATLLIFSGTVYWFYCCCVRRWGNVQIRFASLVFLAIAVHSLVEYPLWYAIMLLPFGILIGAVHDDKMGGRVLQAAGASRRWVLALCLGSVLFMGGMTWDYRRLMIGFGALVLEQQGLHSSQGNTDKPEFSLFPQFYDYLHIAKVNIFPGMPAKDIQFLEKMAVRFGFPPVLQRLAMAYAYNQRAAEALQVLVSVQRLHNDEYTGVYATWVDYAKKDPHYFAEIVKRLPVPAPR